MHLRNDATAKLETLTQFRALKEAASFPGFKSEQIRVVHNLTSPAHLFSEPRAFKYSISREGNTDLQFSCVQTQAIPTFLCVIIRGILTEM